MSITPVSPKNNGQQTLSTQSEEKGKEKDLSIIPQKRFVRILPTEIWLNVFSHFPSIGDVAKLSNIIRFSVAKDVLKYSGLRKIFNIRALQIPHTPSPTSARFKSLLLHELWLKIISYLPSMRDVVNFCTVTNTSVEEDILSVPEALRMQSFQASFIKRMRTIQKDLDAGKENAGFKIYEPLLYFSFKEILKPYRKDHDIQQMATDLAPKREDFNNDEAFEKETNAWRNIILGLPPIVNRYGANRDFQMEKQLISQIYDLLLQGRKEGILDITQIREALEQVIEIHSFMLAEVKSQLNTIAIDLAYKLIGKTPEGCLLVKISNFFSEHSNLVDMETLKSLGSTELSSIVDRVFRIQLRSLRIQLLLFLLHAVNEGSRTLTKNELSAFFSHTVDSFPGMPTMDFSSAISADKDSGALEGGDLSAAALFTLFEHIGVIYREDTPEDRIKARNAIVPPADPEMPNLVVW